MVIFEAERSPGFDWFGWIDFNQLYGRLDDFSPFESPPKKCLLNENILIQL